MKWWKVLFPDNFTWVGTYIANVSTRCSSPLHSSSGGLVWVSSQNVGKIAKFLQSEVVKKENLSSFHYDVGVIKKIYSYMHLLVHSYLSTNKFADS